MTENASEDSDAPTMVPAIKATIDPSVFFDADIRVGIVRQAEPLKRAHHPAVVMEIDFGPLGTKKSSARITHRYNPAKLVGQRVVGVVNFPPRRIAGLLSEVLVLGAIPGEGDVSLLSVDHDDVAPGTPVA